MLTKIFCVAAICCCAAAVSAQSKTASAVENLATVSLLGPGISYESALGKKTSIYGKLYLEPGFTYFHSASVGTEYTLYLDPAITAQFRYYYNHDRREKNARNTKRNSMDYVALFTQAINSTRNISDRLPENKNRLISTVAAVWGMQRNYARRFSFNLAAGPGYSTGQATYYDALGKQYKKTDHALVFIGEVSLGIWLGKKQ